MTEVGMIETGVDMTETGVDMTEIEGVTTATEVMVEGETMAMMRETEGAETGITVIERVMMGAAGAEDLPGNI